MAERIGSVQKAAGGQGYGFFIFDAQDRARLYLGVGSWHGSSRTAREARGLLVMALVCVER
jgi:hypothetical protein